MPHLIRIALLSVSAAALGLGIVVYNRAPDRVWNRVFAVHALFASGWIFSNYFLQFSYSVESAALWLRLAHLIVAMVICTAVELAWVFPERIRPAPTSHRIVLYSIGLLFGLVALAPNLYTSLYLLHGKVMVEYGWPFLLFSLFTGVALCYGDLVFLRKAFRLTGLQRVQVIYILSAMLLGQAVAVTTMIIIPLVWRNTYPSHWGSTAYIFVIAVMAYSIAKHRIVKPQVALLRTAAYVLTGGLIAGVMVTGMALLHNYLEAGNIPVVLAYLVAGIIMGIIVVPVHGYVHQSLTRLTSRPAPDADSEGYTSDAILRTLDADQILEFLADLTMQMLQPTHVYVALLDSPSGDFVVRAHREVRGLSPGPCMEGLPAGHVLVAAVARHRALLDRDQVFRFQSLREAQEISAAMERHEVQVLVPMLWEDELIGLICIGEKRTGEMYEAEELERLSATTPQASLALRNAQLYAEMARYREFGENILREMESGVIAVNGAGKVVLYNPAAARILGMSRQEVLDHAMLLLPPAIRDRLQEALAGKAANSGEQDEITRPDGEVVPVVCNASRLAPPGAEPDWGAVAVVHDLTLVRELEREREEAERLSVIRVLAAGMAHEIRNPLVAIRTFAELLPQRWDDPEFRSTFMGTAQGEVSRIVGLVSELLMLSRPAGSVAKPVNVKEVCETVIRALSAQAEARGVRLTADLPPLSVWPRGDAGRLHQALANLVTNAVDAETEGGEVRVSAEQALNHNGTARVVIRVSNPGSYIPPEQAEEIFQPFVSQKQGGTGLGLAICQTIVREHKGTIEVHSDPALGTEFVVRLPATTEGDLPESQAN